MYGGFFKMVIVKYFQLAWITVDIIDIIPKTTVNDKNT